MATFKVSSLFSVQGQVCVITGGGSGLGEAMALALAENGASKVFILGRRQASLEKVAGKAAKGTIIPIVCDIMSKDALTAAASKVASQTPFINVLIGNSGMTGPVTSTGAVNGSRGLPDLATYQNTLWSTSNTEMNATADLILVSSFYTFLAFVNLLGAGNKHPDSVGSKGYMQSQFISVTSVAAMSRTENVSHIYASSKAALSHLTKMIATTFAPYGIRANSIAPGLFITEMTEGLVGNNNDLSIAGSMPKEHFPATRAGAPEDIAGAALYLVSRAGGFVDGTVLVVDGGMLSQTPGSN
ncbi:short chain dehydrogenase/reductase family [Cadophora sp. DSE1049]|nr:short chain dehydrogenase/reductase family [Cadophora sp. DSE1049]